MRTAQQISDEIVGLLGELTALAGGPKSKSLPTPVKAQLESKSSSGPSGGIRQLVEEGKLNTPKDRSEIAELLKQEGRHYSKKVCGVALLRLVRDRVLSRIKESGSKTWKYVVRR
jgi:hypothetical protein